VAVRRELDQLGFKGEFRFIESYEDNLDVLNGWVSAMKHEIGEFKPDHILFSFHGLPERHILQVSSNCLKPGCCDQYAFERKLCYRRQCFVTTREIVSALGLPADQYSVGFQSRLSKRWIKPFSD